MVNFKQAVSGNVWAWAGFARQSVLMPAKSSYIQAYLCKDTSADWPTHNE